MLMNCNCFRTRLSIFKVLIFSALFFSCRLWAQVPQPQLGVREQTPSVHAFTHCTLVPTPDQVITDATLLIRDGQIEAAGANVSIPADALVHDCKGQWIFPGFIDPWSDWGMPEAEKREPGPGAQPVYDNTRPGSHSWNAAVKPELRADAILSPDSKMAATLRRAGYTTLNCVPRDGVFRGTACLLNLSDEPINEIIAVSRSGLALSFNKGSSIQQYPSSLMGAIALIRQTLYDAQWYANLTKQTSTRSWEKNLSLEVISNAFAEKLPFFFDAGDHLHIQRAMKIAAEFNLSFIYRSTGYDYLIADELKASNASVIMPLLLPKAWDFKDPAEEREVSLDQMSHWENAPWNAYHIQGLNAAFTPAGLKSSDEILDGIRKVTDCGLKMKGALDALTRKPAAILGISQQAGTLEPGKWANFIVCSGNLFEYTHAEIMETWVMGKQFVQLNMPVNDPRGWYEITGAGEPMRLRLSGKISHPAARIFSGTDSADAELSLSLNQLTLSFKQKGEMKRMRGIMTADGMEGSGENANGNSFTWKARRQATDWNPATDPNLRVSKTEKTPPVRFSRAALYQDIGNLQAGTVLIRNARVWTNTAKGVLESADVLVENGKIKSVGPGLNAPANATIIDAAGRHLTPGIIDEHSHIAVQGGVNEGSHNVTAEVRIGDVLNPEDINIYRQLSGGVTCSQLLHGSANPIGGQSALIKLRWGQSAEKMKVENAPGFIKFALGENVKQSNWGDNNTTRYPQTRPGVEQTMRDAFQAAKDYKASWDAWNKTGKKAGLPPPRRVLQLDALLEILEGKRNITCHSYVQSEIMMLMRLADEMGFKVNTFTHILEGYKIASELKKHGANASSFSDWWAYKYEVIDAIPYNPAIMHEHGVNVCVNSDDAEMARRLNQEAAKAVLYGGVKEEDALKMVTLNPAKALHLDHRMGSIQPGMDADVVLWSDHPLSIYARAEYTFIDGIRYFDRTADAAMQAAVQKERERLVSEMLKSGGDKEKNVAWKREPEYNCGDGDH